VRARVEREEETIRADMERELRERVGGEIAGKVETEIRCSDCRTFIMRMRLIMKMRPPRKKKPILGF
jgi:DNA-directed RNA polymerase subunit RPC12/RpoP